MSARTVPTLPTFVTNQVLTASEMTQIMTWLSFWANPPMFKMYQASVQSLPNGGPTTVTMDTSAYDTDSGRSGTTPFGYTIPTGMGGRWYFAWGVAFTGNATGVRDAELRQNGAVVPTGGGAGGYIQTASAGTCMNIGWVETAAAAADVFTVVANQTSTIALNTNVTSGQTSYFSGRLVSLGNP